MTEGGDLLAALVDEATRKTGIAWLAPAPARRGAPAPAAPAADRPRPVWLLWHDGCAYVLHGGSEQPAPALEAPDPEAADREAADREAADLVAVTVPSKDRGGRLVTWLATVGRVDPAADEWAAVVPLLLGKRLNLPDGEAAPARWAAECVLSRLTPTGEVTEGPERMPADAHAAPPPETPATTSTRLPFTVGSATRRAPRPRRLPRRLRRRAR